MYILGPYTVHQPNQNALKQGCLRAWWSHVRSIMASAGDLGMVWCNGWRAAWWRTPGWSLFFHESSCTQERTDLKVCKTAVGRLISTLFSTSLALWEEMAADETDAGSTPRGKQCFAFMLQQQCWRTLEQVLSTGQQITCLHLLGVHTTDISCAWAWIMNGCVFGWAINNKVGSLLSLPLSDTPAASRVN